MRTPRSCSLTSCLYILMLLKFVQLSEHLNCRDSWIHPSPPPLAVRDSMVYCGWSRFPALLTQYCGDLVAELMRTVLNNHPHSANPKTYLWNMVRASIYWEAERKEGKTGSPGGLEIALWGKATIPRCPSLHRVLHYLGYVILMGSVSGDRLLDLSISWEGNGI